MKKVALISLLLFGSLCLANGDIIILTDDNFANLTKSNTTVLVHFYDPQCSHYKSLAAEYKKLMELIKNLPYSLAELDVTIHKNAAQKALVSNLPAVKLYHNGSTFSYKGEYDAKEMFAFIEKKLNPAVQVLSSVTDLAELKNDKGFRCIFATTENSSISTYKLIAQRITEYRFYSADARLVSQVFPGVEKENVILLGDFESEPKIFNGTMTSFDFEAFLEANTSPSLPELNGKIVDQVFVPEGKKGVFLFYLFHEPMIFEEFRRVAEEFAANDYVFATVNVDKNWGHHIADSFGIETSSLPLIEIIEVTDEIIRYQHSDSLTSEGIKTFINDWKEGKVSKVKRSEPEPLENPGPIYTAVTKTFKQIVIDNDDDVVVKFTASWCEPCKTLDPIFANLSQSLAHNAKLKFVQVDGLKNDIEGYPIQAFPMIKVFPGTNKTKLATYEGEQDELAIAKFIKAKSSNPVEIPGEAETEDNKEEPIGGDDAKGTEEDEDERGDDEDEDDDEEEDDEEDEDEDDDEEEDDEEDEDEDDDEKKR